MTDYCRICYAPKGCCDCFPSMTTEQKPLNIGIIMDIQNGGQHI